MQTLLEVPGDDLAALVAADASDADTLMVDIASSAPGACATTARWMAGRTGGPPVFIRISPLLTATINSDLDAIIPHAPTGIVLPDVSDGRDIAHLGAKLAVREAEAGLEDGITEIIAIAPAHPASMFSLGTLSQASRRLVGLAWDAGALARSVGMRSPRAGGVLLEPLRLARSACLFAAAAAGVPAFDTAFEDASDSDLAREAVEASAFGFAGKIAAAPGQVPTLRRIFTRVDAGP